MAVGRSLPTAKTRKQHTPKKQPPPSPNNDNHKCRVKLEDPSVLPDFDIELYWKKEKQWWYLDKKTILHEFWYKNKEGGGCVASWLYRKKVKCKWRRISDDNDYSNDEEEDHSDSECESQSKSESDGGVVKDSTKKSVEGDDGEESITSDEHSSQGVLENALDLMEAASDSWWEDDSDTEQDDDNDDEDYKPRAPKRHRNTRPCDETEVIFSKTKIVKGRVYERHVGEDIWLVKVIEFVGKKSPIRRARCQILFYLHAAIQDCFPHANPECIRQDRRWVYDESVRGKHFMETLTESNEEFDHWCQFVHFNLKRDRKDKLLIELQLRHLQDTQTIKQRRVPKELVLFAGIGGCSIGDKEAGFDISWLVERDHLAAASLKQNHPDATIYVEDVRMFLDKCQDENRGYPSKGDVDHLQSSSPCQGFSRLNRGGINDNDNNSLSMQTVRATEIFRPKTGMLENVTGMLDANNVHHVINILQGLIDTQYQIRIAVHNSCNFGVPQKRRRVIFTFARDDVRLPDMPKATHDEGSFVTLGDAIQDLCNVPCDNAGSGLVQLPNDSLVFNHIASAPRKDTESLCLDGPVNTIATSTSLAHPLQPNRTLSIRELARLFDLPDGTQFFGAMTSIRKQIGNSVPVKLAKAIAAPILAVHDEFEKTPALAGN